MTTTMIPGLGLVEEDEDLGWHYSTPIFVRVLGKKCRIVVDAYDDDENRDDIHRAIENFLSIDRDVLDAAAPHVYRYYQDTVSRLRADDEEHVVINDAREVWSHVRLGDEPMVTRRSHGDKGIYVSLECGCDWEVEHGLQIVFKNGLVVNKVGAYDGHVTNSDAFADARLEDVIYRP